MQFLTGTNHDSAQTSPFWLLVFDLDGTLIDSSRDLCASVNAALKHVGRHSLSDELVASFIGDGASALVERSLRASTEMVKADSGHDVAVSHLPAALSYFLGHYRQHKLDTTTTYPGVLSALHALREQYPGVLMAVLTNKPVNPSRDLCSALGLSRFMFANYGGDSFPTKKPSPEGLLALMSEAQAHLPRHMTDLGNLPASGVVMIGDSAADVLAARNAGTLSLGCTYGLAPEELKQVAPDALVSSPSEWIWGLAGLASKVLSN